MLNRPQLWHVFKRLADSGFTRIAVCGNSSTRRIREEMGAAPLEDVDVVWVESASPRGAAGCVRDAHAALDSDRPLFVVEGSLCLRGAIDLALPRRQNSGIKLYYGHDPNQETRPEGAAEPAGMYWVWPDAVAVIPEHGFFDLKQQLLPALGDAGIEIRMHAIGKLRPRISTVPSYLDLNYSLLVESELDPTILESIGARRMPDAEAWTDGPCQVHPTAQFAGPVLLGRGVKVQENCVIVGPTVIGDGSIIESGAYVRDSVVWRRVRVGQNSELTGILAVDGVEISANTSANYISFVGWHIDLRQAHAWQMAGFSPVPQRALGRGRALLAWQRTAAI